MAGRAFLSALFFCGVLLALWAAFRAAGLDGQANAAIGAMCVLGLAGVTDLVLRYTIGGPHE